MNISSLYTVYATHQMDLIKKRIEMTHSLKQIHHFETEEFNYYVMADNSDNRTDIIEFKNKEVDNGFFALRINVDNFDEMAEILKVNGYNVDGPVVDNEHVTLGIFTKTGKEPNVLLFHHKK